MKKVYITPQTETVQLLGGNILVDVSSPILQGTGQNNGGPLKPW